MGHYASNELAKGRLHVRIYTPVLVPDIAQSHWPVPTADRTDALSRWKDNRQAAKTLPRHLRINTWALYVVRFISPSDLLAAWGIFGGMAAQFGHIAIAMHIATTESADAGLI